MLFSLVCSLKLQCFCTTLKDQSPRLLNILERSVKWHSLRHRFYERFMSDLSIHQERNEMMPHVCLCLWPMCSLSYLIWLRIILSLLKLNRSFLLSASFSFLTCKKPWPSENLILKLGYDISPVSVTSEPTWFVLFFYGFDHKYLCKQWPDNSMLLYSEGA